MSVPAQLWVGSQAILMEALHRELQTHFCKRPTTNSSNKPASCFCSTCVQIGQQAHPNVLTLAPEKNYTVDDIEPLIKKAGFALEVDELFFFILPHAHTLTSACANRLLKILEEPPAGYRFILLTNNAGRILPTIRSRCLLRTFASPAPSSLPALLSYFIDETQWHHPLEFEDELKQLAPSDSESIELLDDLYEHFARKLRDASTSHNETAPHQLTSAELETMVTFLQNALRMPPQSGSSTLFWRNLYLNFPRSDSVE